MPGDARDEVRNRPRGGSGVRPGGPTRPRGAGLVTVALLFAFAAPAAAAAKGDDPPKAAIEAGVVRVLVYTNPPDFFSPWQKMGTQASSGSGVIVEGNRILTNAHVVADAVGVEVKRAGSGEQFEAAVTFVGHDCDLALLTVADERFFEGAHAVELGELPAVNQQVQTYGFPVGGETLSVTSGVVSRVEVGTYAHSGEKLLTAQIDAPINPGNSGGPVIADGKVAGISMQLLEKAENVGYMVPAPVVRHFLDDVADGRYDGFPRLGAQLQPLESPALRQSLGLAVHQAGGLVTRFDHASPADGVLERGDVIVSVDGLEVAGDLTVSMPKAGRVALDAVTGAKQVGEELAMTVLRGGKSVELRVKLKTSTRLVPGRRVGDEPEYFVFGGVVFQPLTGDYFELYDGAPAELSSFAGARNVVTADRRQVVILSTVLPDPVNRGYRDWESLVVRTIDGEAPRDLAHLAAIIDGATGRWLRIDTDNGFVMILERKAAADALPRILAKYGIPRDRSANLPSTAP